MPRFNGPDLTAGDTPRLTQQHQQIRELMLDGCWRTLGQIHDATGHPQASISAQLRHLRKARFGGYVVERKHLGRGLYQYRVHPK